MRSRPSPEHQEAVARRLALLSAELAAARPAAGDPPVDDVDEWTAPHTRVPSPPPGPEPPRPQPPHPAPGGAVPVPGRHASRRPRPGLSAVLPPTLRGRVSLGAAQVAVLAVLVAVGLAVACWWVVRGGADAVVAPVVPTPAAGLVSPDGATSAGGTPAGAGSSGEPLPGATPAAATGGGSVTVDVAGKVRHPGIAVLDVGSRVVDALEAAGGARPGVDLSGLNLARVLVDGEQVVVGVPAPAGQVAGAASSPGAPAGPLVNLNTATQPQLEELPEVGPVTAQAILGWRSEHGGFTSVDELLEVDGIGDATLDQLAPYVTV
jgi:competence protein ComEA